MKILKIISAVSGLCLWLSWFFLWEYFDAHETRVMEPVGGRIYALFTHGSIVYLTARQHYVLYGLSFAGMTFMLLGVVFYLIENKAF